MPDLQRLTVFPFGCGCLKTVNDACIAAQIHSIFLQGIRLEAVPPDAPLNPVATHDSLPLLDERRSAKVLYKSSASSIVHFPSGFFSLTGAIPCRPSCLRLRVASVDAESIQGDLIGSCRFPNVNVRVADFSSEWIARGVSFRQLKGLLRPRARK